MKIRKNPSLCAMIAVILAVLIAFSGCSDEENKAAADTIASASDNAADSAAKDSTAQDNSADDAPEAVAVNTDAPDQTAEPEANTTSATEDDNAAQFELEYTLKDMEDILRRGVYFIVGNKAPAADIITISSLKSALSYKGIDTGDARLADEVLDYTAEDYVVIGSPCDNPVAAKLLAKEIAKKGKCNIFDPGTAWIRIFQTSEDHIALYIGGGAAADTKKAAKAVETFEDHNFQGTTVEVSGDINGPELSMVIN